MTLEIDDYVMVADSENRGVAVLRDVFGDQVLVDMKGQPDRKATVHRSNVKKIQLNAQPH